MRLGRRAASAAMAILLLGGLLTMGMPTPQARAMTLQSNGCYTGYVLVPGDPVYGTSDFCVAQYEAKNVGGVATSQADATPWVNINQNDARTAAATACGGGACHLINENEWMTIAANVERQASNWSGGSVGSGCLYIGNNADDTTCGYTLGSADYGTSRNAKAMYTLSNGSQLWDFAGNVWEWTDATIQQQNQPQPAGWEEYTGVTNFGTISYANPLTNTAGLPGSANTYNSAQRLGLLLSGFSAGSSTVDGFIRGGSFYFTGAYVGPFALVLGSPPSYSYGDIGFRVAQAPLASSASQATQRSITMSSSKAADSGVTYHASFQAGSSYSLRTIVVDFCSDSPVIGAGCTVPGGFSVGTPSVSNLKLGGVADGGSWTATALNGGRTLQYVRSAAVAIVSGETITFDMTGVTNPSAVGSFYGRFLLYDSGSAGYSATQPGHYVDFGGVALSTAAVYTVTAVVQEQLTFCVFSASCGDTPAVSLGTGNPAVISAGSPSYATVKFSIATNAAGGASVALRGSTANLTSGANSIPAIGSTKASITAGTFGQTVKTPGTNFTAASPYGTTTQYARPTTVATTPSTLGTEAVTDTDITTLEYGVQAATTTPSGVYAVSDQLIATGTF